MHAKFAAEMAAKGVYEQILEKHSIQVVKIDVSSQQPLVADLLDFADIPADKVSRKNRPTFLARANDRLIQMKPEYFTTKFESKFAQKITKESSMPELGSVKDLAEALRSGNRGINDSTFVYCAEGEQDFKKYHNQQALQLINSETRNPVLRVSSKALADELQMKPGHFYCYYKPSYANGFQDQIA